jgi:hypothetical protein
MRVTFRAWALCYSICCSPVCNCGGWVRLMLTADHGHPRAAYRQPQVPHLSSAGRMRLTLNHLSRNGHASNCHLLRMHVTLFYRMRLLSLIAHACDVQSMRLVVTSCACALHLEHVPCCHLLRMRVTVRDCAFYVTSGACALCLEHAPCCHLLRMRFGWQINARATCCHLLFLCLSTYDFMHALCCHFLKLLRIWFIFTSCTRVLL